MARRANGLGNLNGKSKVVKNISQEPLDYHEGLSLNQVKIILRESGLGRHFDEWSKWMDGQTCPFVKRYNDKGAVVDAIGFYEYDVFRWIENKKKGTPLVWD